MSNSNQLTEWCKRSAYGTLGLSISMGMFEGVEGFQKFGFNSNVTSILSPIWSKNTDYKWLSQKSKMYVSSSSVNDTYLGTGAWNVIIQGLDENFEPISELINLDGINEVITQSEFLRVNRAFVVNSGDNGGFAVNPIPTNIGNITIEAVEDVGNVQAFIDAELGQTEMLIYTIPAGKTAYLTIAAHSTSEGKTATILAFVRNAAVPFSAWQCKVVWKITNNSVHTYEFTPIPLPEKYDIMYMARTDQTSVEVSGIASFVLADKSLNYRDVFEIPNLVLPV
jgi:hypothetical protein